MITMAGDSVTFQDSILSNAVIVRDILNKANTDQLCLMLIRRSASKTRANFLFQTGICQEHIRTYQRTLIASDPHINNSETALETAPCYASVIQLEDSGVQTPVSRQSTHAGSAYHHYLLDEGIFQTAIYSKRLTKNSMILVGLLSNDRRKCIRLEESRATIEDWVDMCCDELLDNGLSLRQPPFATSLESRVVADDASVLTPRESEVTQHLCRGLTISLETVALTGPEGKKGGS